MKTKTLTDSSTFASSMAEYDPLKTLQQVTTVTQDKTQQTNNNKSEGLESEHIEVEFEESSKLGRKAQQS